MGPRLIRILPLVALALVGCGDRIAATDSLETRLKEANMRSNDGTSVAKANSMRGADRVAPRT